jgi:hypothetical protein
VRRIAIFARCRLNLTWETAALLAHEIISASGVPVIPDLLIRQKRPPPQG